jgi:predicted Fe-Mo cluster-binding NifX family protein
MKIAFVTDDSKTISAHFGRAQYYEVITIMDNKSTIRETRPKANHSHFANENHGRSHGQGHGTDPASQHRHKLIMESINDCQILIARGMGIGAHQSLTANGIRPIITDLSSIEDALNSYLSGELMDHPEKLH